MKRNVLAALTANPCFPGAARAAWGLAAALAVGGSAPGQLPALGDDPAAPQRLPEPVRRQAPRPADAPPQAAPAMARPRVKAVEFEGNSTVNRERLLSYVQTFPGREYDSEQVKKDVAALYRSRLFYDVGHRVAEDADGVVVLFQVAERPIIQSVRFNHKYAVSDDKLIELTGLRAGRPFDHGLHQSLCKELERHYLEKGYPFAAVTLREGGKPTDRNVVFDIVEGPATKVHSIQIKGCTFVSAARLRSTQLRSGQFLGVGRLGVGGQYDPQKVKEDIAALRDYYQSYGFLNVKIKEEVGITADKSSVRLIYNITEGPRYKIGDVQVGGNAKFSRDELTGRLKLQKGQFFAKEVFEKDKQVVQAVYGSAGHINAKVEGDIRFREADGIVDVVYQVQEDVEKKVGQVFIQGNEHTKDRIIRQNIPLTPGARLDADRLKEAQFNLYNTRLFDVQTNPPSVMIDPAGDPSAEYQNVLVNVQEGQTGSLMFGAGINSDAGVGGNLQLTERNFDLFRLPTSFSDLFGGGAFRGAGQELQIQAVPGNLVNRYSISLLEPRLLGSQYSLMSSGYYYRRVFDNYHEQRQGGRFNFGRQLDRYWGAALTVRAEQVRISNAALPGPRELADVVGSHFLCGPRASLTYSTIDSQLAPSAGHSLEAGYEHTFGDYNFGRVNVIARNFATLFSRRDGSGKHVLAFRGEFGLSGTETPLFENFFIGGFQTLRGFQFRGVGPTSFGQEIGGRFMLLSSLEYQFPLTPDDSLGAVFFVDGGTVERRVEINDYRVAAGFGVRVKMPGSGAPLAFDFGFPIAKTSTDDTQVFSFFVGLLR